MLKSAQWLLKGSLLTEIIQHTRAEKSELFVLPKVKDKMCWVCILSNQEQQLIKTEADQKWGHFLLK